MREFIIPTEIPEEIEFYEEYKCEEIVRCKDCEYYRPGLLIECAKLHHSKQSIDWFCADGEKRSD